MPAVPSRKSLNKAIGDLGERAAADALVRRGARILARQWRCDAGEIDLIAERGGEIAFVEVKTRGPRALLSPEEAVDGEKRRRVTAAAGVYLAAWREPSPHRFDVVAVRLDEHDRVVSIDVTERAFGP